jgi:hypothetical protein
MRRESKVSNLSFGGNNGGVGGNISSSSSSSEDSMTTVMVAIILILLVCHTPDRIVQILKYVAIDQSWMLCPHLLFYASNVANLLIVLNSSTNFVVYYAFRPRFRQILWQRLCRRGRPYSSGLAHNGSSYGELPASRRSSRAIDDTVSVLPGGGDRIWTDDMAVRLLLVRNPHSNGRRAVCIDLPVASSDERLRRHSQPG